MIRRYLRRLGVFLASIDGEAKRTSHPTRSSARNRDRSKTAFEHRGRELLERRRISGAPITAGSIQLVGLGEAKLSLGAAWQEVADQAGSIAETVIRSHLTEEDIYVPQGDGSFLICFAELNSIEAKRKARRISEHIGHALAEQLPPEAEGIGVDHFVGEIDSRSIADDRPLADVLAESLMKIKVEAREAAANRRAALLREATVRFRPVWSPAKRAVMIYRAILDSASGRVALDHLRATSDPDDLQEAIAELDYLVFSRVIESLHALVQRQATAMFVVPVHYRTVSQESTRDDYTKLFDSIPDAYRKFVICEIYGIPPGAPPHALTEVISGLRRFCRAVAIEVDGRRTAAVGALAEAGIWGIFLDVGKAAAGNAGQAPEQAPQLGQIVALARSHRLQAAAHNANSLGLLDRALADGFDLIDGEAVHCSLAEPKGPFRCNPLSATPSGGSTLCAS